MVVNQQALDKLRDLLRSEDDLLKLDTIRTTLTKEKLNIDSQLKLEQEVKLKQLQQLLDNLQVSSKDLKDLKDSVLKLDNLSTSNQVIDKNLNFSSFGLKNFQEVELIYNQFSNLNDKLKLIDQLIALELKNGNGEVEETSSGDNILIIHYEITKLHDFKDELMQLSKTSTTDVRMTVKSTLEPLDNLLIKFDSIIKSIIESFSEIIDCGNYGLLIKLIKVIQYEDKEDFKLLLMNKLSSSSDQKDSSSSYSTKKIKRTTQRNYRQSFEKHFESHINSFFDSLKAQPHDEALKLIQENYYDTLQIYKHGIDTCFPTSWNFFDKRVLKWYQKSLSKFITEILDDPAITNQFIVELIQFDYDNKKQLKELFKIRKADQDEISILQPDQKNKLLEDILQQQTNQTAEWVNNALIPVFKMFKERFKEPPEQKDVPMGLETAQNIIQMFKASINYLLDIGDSTILTKFLNNFSTQILQNFYNRWTEVINSESGKWNAESSDPTIGLLPRYITIVANDMVKLVDGLDNVFKDNLQYVHVSYHDRINEASEIAAQHAIEIGSLCVDKLNYFMYIEYKPLLDDVFTKGWYKSNGLMMEETMRTIDENYMMPYQEYLNDELFISLFDMGLGKFLITYFTKMSEKKATFDKKKFQSKFEKDGALIGDIFMKYDVVGILDKDVPILDAIISVLCECEAENDYIEKWREIVGWFWDIPVSFMKMLLEFKKVKDSKVKFILEECAMITGEGFNEGTFMRDFKYD